jgi:transcriptional regulator
MYVPEAFDETRPAALAALIRDHPLGLLVSGGPAGLLANPVPFRLDPEGGPHGVLRAHLARANPQWRAIAEAPEVLVVFQGPQAYVTPSWYATKRDHGRVVPTWNYMIVPSRGRATLHHNPAWLRRQIDALTAAREAARPEPWAVADAPEPFVAAQLRGIVGVEVAVAALVGKWKLSQNRSAADRAGVAAGLAAEGADAVARRVAAPDGA